MATPKRRISHARTHDRKAKFLGALHGPSLTTCKACGEVIMAHRACPSCGAYRGRTVVKTASEDE